MNWLSSRNIPQPGSLLAMTVPRPEHTCTARTARRGLLLSLVGRRLTGLELLTPLGFHNKAESAVRLRSHPVLSLGLCAPVSLLDRLPRAPTCSSCFTSCHSAGVLGGKRRFLSVRDKVFLCLHCLGGGRNFKDVCASLLSWNSWGPAFPWLSDGYCVQGRGPEGTH